MLTDFYTQDAIERQGEEYTCVIRLNPEHEVYKGHFPDMPVVPGVCMLYVIKECVSAALGVPVRYQTVNSCKFLSVVNPLEHKTLTLKFSLKGEKELQVIAGTDETIVLKLKATIVTGL